MNTKIAENEVLQSLAEDYRRDGYTVIVEPDADKIPFDLNNYRPDILAIKDDSKLIIEVKNNLKRTSIERLQSIAQLIAEHEGWHFVVVTLDDLLDNDEIDAEIIYRSWEEIAQQLAQLPLIVQLIGNNTALLYIWGICEAVLRRYAYEMAIPVERLPFIRLANCLYSAGELSMRDLDTLLEIHKQRNKVAHGFKIEINQETLNRLIDFIQQSLTVRTTATA